MYYVDSRGERWVLSDDCPPVPYRGDDWSAVHEDYGGPGDDRVVRAISKEEAIKAVEEFIREEYGE